MFIRKSVILICLLASTALFAQPGPNDVFVRVVDSGAALCCVVQMPGNRYMIYDAILETSPSIEGPGTKIGRYELLELIGDFELKNESGFYFQGLKAGWAWST